MGIINQQIRFNPQLLRAVSNANLIRASYFGGAIFHSIIENVCEFCAYDWSSAGAAPIAKNVGTVVGEYTGKAAGIIIPYFVAKLLVDLNKKRRISEIQKSITSVFIFCAAFYQLHALLDQSITKLSKDSFGLVFEYSAYYFFGLLMGFLAVKLNGSQEFFFRKQNINNSYVFKTILSMLGTYLIDMSFPKLTQYPSQPITDLAIGSIIYNSQDLFGLMQVAIRGELLNEVLNKKIYDFQYFNTVVRPSAHDEISRRCARYIIANFEILQAFSGEMQNIIRSPIEQISNPMFLQYAEKFGDNFSATVVRGVNLYYDMKKTGINVYHQMNVEDLVNYLSEHHRDIAIDKVRYLFENIRGSFISRQQKAYIIEIILNFVNTIQIRAVGVSMSTVSQRQMIHDFVNKELENIVISCLICTCLNNFQTSEADVRNYYINLVQIIGNYYSSMFGKSVMNAVQKLIIHQINNSQFSD